MHFPVPAYYRGAMGILLVYDVSDERSFRNVRNWARQIEQHAAEHVQRLLIGNKCDLPESERRVTTEQGQQLAAELGIGFFETSAKGNINVEQAFMTMASNVVERLEQEDMANTPKATGGITLSGEKKKGKSSCCK